MPNVPIHSVDDYLAVQPAAVKSILEQVRSTIRKAIPQAEEAIAYNIPAYKLQGEPVLYFAGWKKYLSLYPATATTLAEFKDELAGCVINKSTIRISYAQPLPLKLIARIAKFRAREVAAKVSAKKP